MDLIDRQSICYAAGVGEDVSFDLALVKQVGCEVWAIDPTPRSVAYMQTIDDKRLHFVPVGLWSEDTTLRFYAPANPSHVSHSVVNAQNTNRYFEAEVVTLETVMRRNGHARIDLLKLDIEGAELSVLEAMLAGSVRPRVLCVEFDAPESVRTLTAFVAKLGREGGYAPVRVDGLNVTFVRG